MSLIRGLLDRFRMLGGVPSNVGGVRCSDMPCEAMTRAHGDWLSLLATVLEREGVIAGDELARLLAEYAAVTAVDRPAEGRILLKWATTLQGTADGLKDHPALH